MTAARLTPSQTIGPFFHPAMLREDMRRNVLVQPETAGERIRVEGCVYDGEGSPISDALVEIWQANSHGRYRHPADTQELPLDLAFGGFGRCGTEEDGRYWFETIKPGAVPFDEREHQAPHIAVTVFARGLLNHLATRLYFEDEPGNAADPILRLVPEERRATLVARRVPGGDPPLYRFDIILQGEGETAFFNV